MITDLMRGALTQDLGASIEVPIFKNGQPFRGLAIIIRHREFRRLLNVQDIPRNWLAAIIDGEGRFIARVPKGALRSANSPLKGGAPSKIKRDCSSSHPLRATRSLRANAHPSMSSWTVGVAVKKVELQKAAWTTVRWAVMLGTGLSAASLLLAWFLARQITRPIDQLRQSFADVSAATWQAD